jgi:hypothetical protein
MLKFIVSMQSITDSFKDLNNRYKVVCNLHDRITKGEEKLEEDDKSEIFFDSFFDNARRAVMMVEEKIKSIEDKYKDLIAYFGDTPKDFSMDVLIETFNKFNKDLTVNKFIISF